MESRLTVVVTTSPTRSNPFTDVIEAVFESFRQVPGLAACRKLIVFDGYLSVPDAEKLPKFKSGRIRSRDVAPYAAYVDNVRRLIETHAAFANTTPLVLDERHGFGHAVLAGLRHVTTPYVMVVQHDYQFVQSLPGEAILDLMDARPDINYVGFKGAANTTHVLSHKALVNVLRRRGVPLTMVPDLPVPLAKVLFWYDKNHIARVSYYRDVVLAPDSVVRRGDFIEDRFGHKMLADIREGGDAAHERYGTYLYHPDDGSVALRHLDGRKYLRPEQIRARYPIARPRDILPAEYRSSTGIGHYLSAAVAVDTSAARDNVCDVAADDSERSPCQPAMLPTAEGVRVAVG